ncbi:MAG: hypothetical protein ACJAZP_002970 [Psychromonas sp.]|jgi:hypothetical protein|uniref:DUF2161 domain-containing phosphodiesterase n=1 Tax=Psychromonas sp. TaxID=1884585 RepID=UPI0039E2FB2B
MTNKLKESDLYLPIKAFLENLGYQVKGEINDCDIVAKKNDSDLNNSLIIIELKLNLNITLLLQAVERLSVADTVYIAIPKHSPIYKKQASKVQKLIKLLGIGLIVVDMQKERQYVEVLNDPNDYVPRKNKRKQGALLKEFSTRIGDPQKGGSKSTGAVLTAYRQRCIRVAQYLSELPSSKGFEIKNAINEPQATLFLRDNYYGWFEKIDRGIYSISEKGINELPEWLIKMNKLSL